MGQGVRVEQGLSCPATVGEVSMCQLYSTFRRAQCYSVSPRLGAPPPLHTPAGMTHSSPVAGGPCGTGAGGGGEESPAGNGSLGALSPSVTHASQTSEQTAALQKHK